MAYDYFDVERDSRADELVRTMNDGQQRYPVVVIDEQAITNPTLAQLGRLLRDHRVEPRPGPRADRRQTGDL